MMPPLTRAADHSKLWFAWPQRLAATGKSSARRGAARGVITLAVTSLFTNQVAKRVSQRPRPNVRFRATAASHPATPDIQFVAVWPFG